MICIGKAEAEYLRNKYPNLQIHRTVKQHSNRHRYYVEESPKVLRSLEKMEKENRAYE